MVRDYLMFLRTAWLGMLWSCVYLVRPVLESQGYFPHHGLDVLNWAVAVGALIGLLMTLLCVWRKLFDWQSRPQQLMLVMVLLSLGWFGLTPWWKLQMVLLHGLSLLGVLWLWMAPRRVV
ncbi:hypothetical protein [Oceanobacter kriegii]|uniref:hypothetical protein n=1 Tax=Oceanobacter kriegii TaxID=64972 RepID=UPI000487E345|nr:hypothetical protein [Oceanobacter kriegii]